jgi:two-component system, OmpR family, phosphate regulon sensor histidine kinase PhoR
VKRKNIILIIIIMTAALVGLLSMQLYWIRSASAFKESSFRRSVNDAMAKVVYKVELMEKRKASEANLSGGMLNFSSHLGYEAFLDSRALDSLITLELNIRGVDTRYEFGIYKPEKDQFLLGISGQNNDQLVRKGYAFQLFSTDIFTSPEYLLIWFPSEKQFLLTDLWGMLLVSIILIVVIVYSFSYTITTLLRQRRLSEMKNDFINNMTHEFRTPIASISLACETLGDKDIPKSEEFIASYIGMISDEAKRLGLLSEKILQTAVIEKGQLKMQKEPVDLHMVIREVAKNLLIQVEIKDGEIIPDLKAAPSVLEGDRVHLTNLVYNLLDNANKYSRRKPVIRITTENNGNGILMTITDNGIGISKAEMKKIFQKLYRVHTGNIHDIRGFGLGLNYVKAIVEEHRGKITVESEVNAGSSFRIYLPYRIPDH